MQWNSVSEFLAMGGYAFYVWGSFGMTAVVVALEILVIHLQRKSTLRHLRSQLESELESESASS